MDQKGVRAMEKGKCCVGLEKELENYRSRCSDLEERGRKAETRCLSLGLEVEKKKNELRLLEDEFRALKAEKRAIEEEFGFLKRRGDELEEHVSQTKGNMVGEVNTEGKIVIDLSDESEEKEKDGVLEYDKKLDKGQAVTCKGESRELEERVSLLEKKCLRLRVEEHPLAGTVEVDLDHGVEGKHSRKLYEQGSNDMARLDHVQPKEMVMDFVEPVCDSSSVGSASCSLGDRVEELQMTGTTCIDTPQKYSAFHAHNGEKSSIQLQTHMEYGKRARKRLLFEEGTPSKKMAPSTPAGATPSSVIAIHISDDDDPDNILHARKPTHDVCGNGLKSSHSDQSNEDEANGCSENYLFKSNPKRRRTSNVVVSDDDSNCDSDDNLPICAVRRKYLRGKFPVATASVSALGGDITDSVAPTWRRLVKMKHCEEKDGLTRKSQRNLMSNETKHFQGISTAKSVEDQEMEGTGSESEGGSLGGFIVDSSSDAGRDDRSDHMEDASDDNLDFGEIMSTIGSRRNHKSVWEFEADMLAAFGKDPELCMKAVCALYRQQTSEEQCSKEAFYQNRRGFSKFDAYRGTAIAEFLTGGNPYGDVQMSGEELLENDPEVLEHCKTLATRYSKQLFEIYKSNEDPLFSSSVI